MSVTATSSLAAVRQEIGRTEAPRLKAALQAAVADNSLDAKDYQDLRTAFQAVNPGASDADFDTYLKTKLQLDPAKLKAHENKPVGLSFPEPKAGRDIALRVSGLSLSDMDGVEQLSRNDLSGKVSKIEGQFDLSGETRKTIADAADAATGGWANTFGLTGKDFKATYMPAKDGKPAYQQLTLGVVHVGDLSTDAQGRLVLNSGAVLDIANLFSENGIAGPLRDAIQQYTGLDTKVEKDSQGRLVFVPQRLNLSGSQLGGEATKSLQGAQLEVKGETRFEITPKGIGFRLENGTISGSSNAAGPEAVGRKGDRGEDTADKLEVEQASFDASVKSDGKGQVKLEGEVSDVKASAKVRKTLSQADVKAIQAKIEQVRGKIDDFLKTYGLNREALEQIINKVGRDQIQTLLKSANPGAISSTAQQFGIDPKQLEATLSAVREAPFRQMLDELNTLGTSLSEGARLDAEVKLSLDQAGFDSSANYGLTNLAGLDVSAAGSLKGPDGSTTRFSADTSVSSARSEDDKTLVGPASTTLEVETTQADGSKVRVVGDVATSGETSLYQANGVWSGYTPETRYSAAFSAFDPTSARTSFVMGNGILGATTVSPDGQTSIASHQLHVEGEVQEKGKSEKGKKPKPGPQTSFNADLSSGPISTRPDLPGKPAQLAAEDVSLTAGIATGPKGKKPVSTAEITVSADQLKADGQAITADGARVEGSLKGRQQIGFSTRDPESKAKQPEGTRLSVSNQGISMDPVAVDWSLRQSQGIGVDAKGTTTVKVKDNQVVNANTGNVRGSIEAGTQQLLKIAAQNPTFKGFIDRFLTGNDVQIDNDRLKVAFSQGYVKNNKDNGAVLKLGNLSTNYGTASAEVKLETKGGKSSYTGSLSITPTHLAAKRINEFLAKETGMKTGLTIGGGKIAVTASDLFASAAATIKLNGEYIDISIDDAKLLHLIKAKGMAHDKAMAALKKFKAEATSDTSLRIPVRELAREALGPEVAKKLDLKARQDGINISLDFRYAP